LSTILSENRIPLYRERGPSGRDHPLEAQASIKVDVSERLLLLVGKYAAGNGARDHKCVLEFFAALQALSVRRTKSRNIGSATASGSMDVRAAKART
jgi:hypothetical protein